MSTWGVVDKDLSVSKILDWQFSSSRHVSVCESVCTCVCVCVLQELQLSDPFPHSPWGLTAF